MKKTVIITIAFFCGECAFAQKNKTPLYNRDTIDSLFRERSKSNQPFILSVPKEYGLPGHVLPESNGSSFGTAHPGAAIINKTTRGPIYNMPLDNMAVLVPAADQLEKMPVIGNYRQAPPGNMPNPLYPNAQPKKKKITIK